MIDSLFNFIAPHPCYGCGKVGSPLCSNCKYDIENEPFAGCIVCGSASGKNGICIPCRTSYTRAWCAGERSDALLRLIDAYKFERARACYRPLADLLVEQLPELPPETVIVPIPTVASHIRERGYDHTHLIAKRVAEKTGLALQTVLVRQASAKQRGASRKDRIAQAKHAFRVRSPLLRDRPYLIVDDVVTTGATLQYAAESLRKSGAGDVWVTVVARQTVQSNKPV